jgi:glycosyltransferase involved in cell wall biosynthesis
MKVLIDGQTLLTPEITRGIGTYFKNTVENILENDFTNDFYLSTADSSHLDHLSPWARSKLCVVNNHAQNIGATQKHSAEHLNERYSDAVNNEIEKRGIDLYWSPNALMDNVFLAARQSTCRFAVTIFDLIVLVMEKEYEKHWSSSGLTSYKNKLKVLENDYDLFLHISRHTRADFTRILKVRDQRHVVTPLAPNSLFRPYPFPTASDTNDYVLYPGGFDPRKNMDRAIEAFSRLQTKYGDDARIAATEFIIVCRYDEASRNNLLSRAESLGLGGKIKLTGYVDDDALLKLYQKARCLFFPSLYEGFGLPLLEGFACGLPVASSNSSSLPEVGSDLAIYFDPNDIDEMAAALYQALQAPMDYESRLRRNEHSRRFSWCQTALMTIQAFEECVNTVRETEQCRVNQVLKGAG